MPKRKRGPSIMDQIDKEMQALLRAARREYMRVWRDQNRKRKFSPRPQTRKNQKKRGKQK